MRTTVTIDDHLLAEAKAAAAKQHRTLGEVIEDSLRSSLNRRQARTERVELPTFGTRDERPLVDLLDKEALAEALGDDERRRRDDVDR